MINYGHHKFVLLLFHSMYCSLSNLVTSVSEMLFETAFWEQPAIWGQNPRRMTADELVSDLDQEFWSFIFPEGSQLGFLGLSFLGNCLQ